MCLREIYRPCFSVSGINKTQKTWTWCFIHPDINGCLFLRWYTVRTTGRREEKGPVSFTVFGCFSRKTAWGELLWRSTTLRNYISLQALLFHTKLVSDTHLSYVFFFLKLGFNPDEKNVPMFTAPSKTLTTFGRTHKQHNGNMIKEMARGKKKKNADYPQCPFFFVLILSNATITPPVCFLWSKPEWKNVIRSFSFTLPNNKPRPRDVNKKSCRFETLGQRGRWSCLCLLLPIIPVSCFL